MALTIPKSELDHLDFDLASAVASYLAALAEHAFTENVPAPTTHPLVEQIARMHEGQFVIVDDTPIETREQVRQRLGQTVYAELTARMDALASPGHRQLAQIDFTLLGAKAKLDRTPAEEARLTEVRNLFASLNALGRHAALLQIEIEDLADKHLDGWLPHSWPT